MGYTWLPGRFSIFLDVEPYEAMQVLTSGRRLPRRVITPHGVAMLGVLGRTRAGRYLTVFIRHDGGLDWLVVGARAMSVVETAEYDEWEAQA